MSETSIGSGEHPKVVDLMDEEPGEGMGVVTDEGERWVYDPIDTEHRYDSKDHGLIEETVRPVFAPPLGEKKKEGE